MEAILKQFREVEDGLFAERSQLVQDIISQLTTRAGKLEKGHGGTSVARLQPSCVLLP